MGEGWVGGENRRPSRMLATSLPRRWAIEQIFRTMKTDGFNIEAVRMENDTPREILATATLVVAVTIQQLVHARDGANEPRLRPLIDAFEPEDQPVLEAFCAQVEGKTQRQKTLIPAVRSPNGERFPFRHRRDTTRIEIGEDDVHRNQVLSSKCWL